MKSTTNSSIGQPVGMALSLLSWHLCQGTVQANPTGATYAPGAASLKTTGSQLTITTPGNAYINWQHFNINAGETTTFVEPSSTSVVWNQINDANPSQILGTLNANGYIVLQNQSGFVVGGQAAINAHGLVMTTAASTVPDLASSGAWTFNAPPPTAKIINYGQINTFGGGPAFLIASDIENETETVADKTYTGTISAPGGKIGLYAGETVLVSPTSDGRSLSAQVTLPQGSVDNKGNLIADAGTIAALAQTVNQNGLVQANSAQKVDGVIELVASDSLTLGAKSEIEAHGDNDAATVGTSSGGSITLQSGNTFADQSGSFINVSGNTQGGTGGQVTITAPQMTALNSTLNGLANSSDANGTLAIDTTSILLNADGSAAPSGLALNANTFSTGFSTINLQAADAIEIAAPLNLPDKSGVIGSVSLAAGTTLNVDAGAGIVADGGHISLNAATVNQNGRLQANSVTTASGVIDIDANQAITLGATATISAEGYISSQPTPGGSVVLQSGNTLALAQGSVISADGGKMSLQAAAINQSGRLQANSVNTVAGKIAENATAAITLGGSSDIEANSDNTVANSPGGAVTLLAGNTLEAQAGSVINASTSANDGVVGQPAAVSVQSGNTLALDQGSAIKVNGGNLSLQAATINQNGRLQANSVSTTAGAITLDATAAINLGASSDIEANGDNPAVNSPGGSITLQAGSAFTDQAGSLLGVAGGTQGGAGGQVTITAPQMSALNSTLNGTANAGDANGSLAIDTTSILLNADGSAALSGLALNANTFGTGFSTISLQAADSIEVAATLNVPDKNNVIGSLSLAAGNTINVDAGGGIVADGGHLALNAATVNQNGLLQANSVGTANGVIDVLASQAINLGATSTISAQGDATSASPSPGGFVVLQSANTFADTAGSTINVAGQSGAPDGLIEISGSGAASLQSTLSTYYALLINPYDLTLSANATDASPVDPNDPTKTDPNVNVSDLANYSQIDLRALDNIEVASPLTLPDASAASSVSLSAGNNLTLDLGANIVAGNNWSVNLVAGTGLPSGTQPTVGNDGIYLNGGAVVQTQNGNITATAANEVIIQDAYVNDALEQIPSGAIRTLAGGSIAVTAQLGNVYSGDNINGFDFGLTAAPWYKVNAANLGGISTAAGGNVSITAGGSVTSYLPNQNDYNAIDAAYDGGSGAFGGGNVTITAGTTVAGNYVLANGVGSITAGGDAGVAGTGSAGSFALSLVKGSWTVSARNIYLDDVLNPNGMFNNASTKITIGRNGNPNPSGAPGKYLFNYDPAASVTLNGANSVEITGAQVPLQQVDPDADYEQYPALLPILFPPSLTINAGADGIVLDTSVTLFASPLGNVNLTTTSGGSFFTRQNVPNTITTDNFQMSDSGNLNWDPYAVQNSKPATFGIGDHAGTPPELNNPNPVEINLAGSLEDVNIYTTKQTDLTVQGNLFNGSLIGENLSASDVTAVKVAGSISFSPLYSLTPLTAPLSAGSLNLLSLVVDYTVGDPNSVANPIPAADIGNANALQTLALSDTLANINSTLPPDLGFVYYYAPATLTTPVVQQLGYVAQMSPTLGSTLQKPLEIIQYAFGQPQIALGQSSLGQDPAKYYFVTTPVTFDPLTLPAGGSTPVSAIATLENSSQASVATPSSLPIGFQIGGPGQFDLNAGKLDLGASGGIVSWGGGNGTQIVGGGVNYASLDTLTGAAGASIDVTVSGNINLLTSAIATIGGGDVTVTSTGGEIDLGLAGVPFNPPGNNNLTFGIFTSGAGDVNVTANNNINVDTARIATFNGGNVNIESYNGDVNAGDGVNELLNVPFYYPDNSILDTTPAINNLRPYGSGIMALSPTTTEFQIPGSDGLPGNITVTTPNGDIESTLGGISQFALNRNVGAGPVVSLTAGTPPKEDYIKDPSGLLKDSKGQVLFGKLVNGAFVPEGNIDLGQGGAVGGEVDLTAQGDIAGLIVSRQNSTVTSPQAVSVTVISGGSASVSGGTVTGLVIAQTSASVSGEDGGVTVFSESASGSAGVASSLGTATASASATGAAAESSKPLAATATTDDDDLDKKKKGAPATLKIKRVTIILPGKTTASRQTPADAL